MIRSHILFWLGDLTSRTPWFKAYGFGWKFYQTCMTESIRLDVDCKLWKKP